MGWLFRRKNKSNRDRDGFREQFEQTIAMLKDADSIKRAAVAHGLNLASSFLSQTHGSIDGFRDAPKHAQLDYMRKLGDLEKGLYEKGDVAAALAFGLFKMWLATISQDDDELSQAFAKELALLSEEGDFSI